MNGRASVWARAAALDAGGVPYALATVVRAARPASCRPGDRAIVHPDGRIDGWVGGSCAQPSVVAEALGALRDGEPRLVVVTPHHDFPAREGMAVHAMTCISGGEIEVLVEPVIPPPQLVVCGASPVAAALVAIGAGAGFEVVAVDPDATPDRFPQARHVLTSLEVIDGSPLGASRERHVVAATHGQWDEAAIEGALRLGVATVGLVASRRRYEATIADLEATGVDPARLAMVRSRPGLDLGGTLPGEVALGIVAEIVSIRRGGLAPRSRGRGSGTGASLPRPATLLGEDKDGGSGGNPDRQAVMHADADTVVEPALVEDPSCGMMVDPRTTPFRLVHEGTTWHYCNDRCRRRHARELGMEASATTVARA